MWIKNPGLILIIVSVLNFIQFPLISCLYLDNILDVESLSDDVEDLSCKSRKGGRDLAGSCQSLDKCEAGLSDLRAGIQPTLCNINSEERGIPQVCCPTEPRISEKKCDEYEKWEQEKEVASRPIPLLPLEILEDRISFSSSSSRSSDSSSSSSSSSSFRGHCKKTPLKLIVGGRDASAEEFPHAAALGYGELEQGKWLCGGTLISQNFVLTAAHCARPGNQVGPVRRVLLGTLRLPKPKRNKNKKNSNRIDEDNNNNNSSSAEIDDVETDADNEFDESRNDDLQIVDVEEIFTHPEYKPPLYYNDIAVLRLAKRVKFSKSIFPACLPQPSYRLEKLNRTQVIGWGQLETGGAQSNVLQAVQLFRIPQKNCEEIYANKPDRQFKYPDGILRSQFCASDVNKDSCNGDSGSGLTVRRENDSCSYYVVGVVSFGSSVCANGDPGVYTNIQSFLDWLEETVWPADKTTIQHTATNYNNNNNYINNNNNNNNFQAILLT